MTRPADNTAARCPVCGAPDVETGTAVCGRCGAPTDVETTGALAPGARVANRYVIESVRWSWPGVTYYAARLETNANERVLLAERNAAAADPLEDVGLAKPGETAYLAANPFHTEHAVLSRFDYSGIVKSREIFVDGGRAYMALDWAEGEPLASSGQVNEGEVRAWGLQLCQIVSL